MLRGRVCNADSKKYIRRSYLSIASNSDRCILPNQVDCPRYSNTRCEYQKQIKGEMML